MKTFKEIIKHRDLLIENDAWDMFCCIEKQLENLTEVSNWYQLKDLTEFPEYKYSIPIYSKLVLKSLNRKLYKHGWKVKIEPCRPANVRYRWIYAYYLHKLTFLDKVWYILWKQ